jgi:hypothetical protein
MGKSIAEKLRPGESLPGLNIWRSSVSRLGSFRAGQRRSRVRFIDENERTKPKTLHHTLVLKIWPYGLAFTNWGVAEEAEDRSGNVPVRRLGAFL